MPAVQKWDMRTRKQDKASRAYQDAKARRVCTDTLWDGESYQPCHYCGRYVARGGTFFGAVGAVHEPVARSLMGDATDASVNVITCHSCHSNGPSGAHRASERPHA